MAMRRVQSVAYLF